MSLFDLRDVCIVIGSLATLDSPMVVDLIGIYVLKGPYCTLTMTNYFLQALSVIPRGSWGNVSRRFTMIRWEYWSKLFVRSALDAGIFEFMSFRFDLKCIRFDDVMLYVGIEVADVSFAAGSLAHIVLCFGSWRQQRLRGFQQESAIGFRNGVVLRNQSMREEDATSFELVATPRIDVAAGSIRGVVFYVVLVLRVDVESCWQ
ncbi:F-box family protein [Dorcoceras hygrometricum]|uniref:F-box family protein n=1 Tax=Dorcoceras hygrometricum TaxID=472368 RepID=A0A2Z7AWU0_9LAMI|nr:F-box family protein [Dorcoceras hygrometricum]